MCVHSTLIPRSSRLEAMSRLMAYLGRTPLAADWAALTRAPANWPTQGGPQTEHLDVGAAL
jgi:hypothetical protein